MTRGAKLKVQNYNSKTAAVARALIQIYCEFKIGCWVEKDGMRLHLSSTLTFQG